MADPNALLSKYQLAPLPGNVHRLGKLIEGGFERNADEIALIIANDAGLSAKVIKIATNGKKRAEPLEIESAVVRLGVGSITLIVMGELLQHAIIKTFDTMLGAVVEPLDEEINLHQQIVGCIYFEGKANGHVFLRIPASAAEWLVGHLWGKEAVTDEAPELMKDIVGEVLNIVCGNFKSNLCDAGLSCKLMPPTVESRPSYEPEFSDDEKHQLVSLYTEGIPILLNLIITPITDVKKQ